MLEKGGSNPRYRVASRMPFQELQSRQGQNQRISRSKDTESGAGSELQTPSAEPGWELGAHHPTTPKLPLHGGEEGQNWQRMSQQHCACTR